VGDDGFRSAFCVFFAESSCGCHLSVFSFEAVGHHWVFKPLHQFRPLAVQALHECLFRLFQSHNFVVFVLFTACKFSVFVRDVSFRTCFSLPDSAI
jgi:hypothetical protein